MINLENVTTRLWIQFDTDDLPFFRIAWGRELWGPWIGWN